MRSLLRSVKKRKKRRVLGEVEVMSREEYSGLELDSKVEMIRALIPLGLMHVEELLDEEVKALAGERYARLGYPHRLPSANNLPPGCCFLRKTSRAWRPRRGPQRALTDRGPE